MTRVRWAGLLWLAIAGLLCGKPAHAADSAVCGPDGPLPAACGNIVFDGDSISAGMGAPAGHGPDIQFLAGLGRPARLANVAVSGRPVVDCVALFSVDVAPRYVPGAAFNLILFHAGDNDILRGASSVQTYRAFRDYLAAAHAQGWLVVVSTELPRPDLTPDLQARLEDYNSRLLANHVGADAVADLSQDPRLTDPQDRTASGLYAKDNVHLSEAGYARMVALLVAAARPLLP